MGIWPKTQVITIGTVRFLTGLKLTIQNPVHGSNAIVALADSWMLNQVEIHLKEFQEKKINFERGGALCKG